LIRDEIIGFFNLPNLSSRTMALRSTQSLTEISTKDVPAGKGRQAYVMTTSPPSVSRLLSMTVNILLKQKTE
jgi:hypothetical protein